MWSKEEKGKTQPECLSACCLCGKGFVELLACMFNLQLFPQAAGARGCANHMHHSTHTLHYNAQHNKLTHESTRACNAQAHA